MKIMIFFRTIAFLSFSLISMQCISLGSFQTAQVTPDNEFSGGFALYKTDVKTETITEIFDTSSISYYVIEGWAKYGILNFLEIGLRFIPIGIYGNAKLQFVDSFLDMAVDVSAGYVDYGSSNSKIKIIDINSTFLLSMNFSEGFSLTLAPKYLFRTYKGETTEEKNSMVGALATLCFTRPNGAKILPEFGYFKDNGSKTTFMSYGIGFSFGF